MVEGLHCTVQGAQLTLIMIEVRVEHGMTFVALECILYGIIDPKFDG
jgi:hypothetical protein